MIFPFHGFDFPFSRGQQIDDCQRLWVMDTGRIGNNQLCPPQILIFDLNTDVLVHRYKVPADQIKAGVTLHITPVRARGYSPTLGALLGQQ